MEPLAHSSRIVVGTVLALCAVLAAGPAVSQQSGQSASKIVEPSNHGRPASLSATDLFPLRQWTRSFKITDGNGSGQTKTVSLSPDPKVKNGWILKFDDYNNVYIKENENGDLVFYRLQSLNHGKQVVYDPPILFMPAHTQPQQAHEHHGQATISNIGGGGLDITAKYTHRLEPLASSDFDTPGGKYSGYMLELNHTLHLPLVKVQVRIEAGLVPNEGLVYRRIKWTVQEVWIFDQTASRTIALDQPLKD